MIVEVFKTNVMEHDHARMLIAQINKIFNGYKVNFDLDDCDKIMRVTYNGKIHNILLIELLRDYGFTAEVLPDSNAPQTEFEPLRFTYN